MSDTVFWRISIGFFAVGGAVMLVAVAGMHTAACGMHVAAVEMYRSHRTADQSRFGWSYDYCKFVTRVSPL